MNKFVLSFLLLLFYYKGFSQQSNGFTFQGIARDPSGFILSNKVFNLKISILFDTTGSNIIYQELTSLKTDALGYFSTNIGTISQGKMITIGSFDAIRWDTSQLYLHVEIDLENNLIFSSMGFEKITAAPLALAAKMIDAQNIKGILAIEKGGTGTNSIEIFKTSMGWDSKLNKTDTINLSSRINLKLSKTDTSTLSNRINLKMNRSDFNKDTLVKMLSNTSLDIDTTYLSNRINLKLSKTDTATLSNRINLKMNRSDFNKDTLVKMLSNTSLDIDTTYLSNRINLKLSKTDTATLSNRINLKLNKSDFNKDTLVKMLTNTTLDIDTTFLSNRINLKLSKTDTSTLSNRINLKLNKSDFNKDTLVKMLTNTSLDIDTTFLSNRINLKLSKTDTSTLSNRINLKLNKSDFTSDSIIKMINYSPKTIEYGSFYDTSKQSTIINTATAVIWNFSNSKNNISISNNMSGVPTKINNITAGTFEINYQLQFIKSDSNTDEISIWIRKNGAAYPFTNKNVTIIGGNAKNIISGNYLIDLGTTDYIELFYNIKSITSILQSTNTLTNPSRPMTPSAYIQICKIN